MMKNSRLASPRLLATGLALAAVAGLLVLAGCNQAEAHPEWDTSNESNEATIDHGMWQQLLDRYVHPHESGINRVDYASLKANADDSALLDSYIDSLQGIDPRGYSRDVQMAYWINFYNALTVKVVAEAYPVDSIRDIGEGLGSLIGTGPWSDEVTEVAGVPLTLDNIEHNILRPIWQDPRIHYAVNCASHGCPNLSKTVYTAANLEEQMEAGAAEYVNHLRGVDLIDEDFLVISSIYTWFVEDFGDSEEGVLAHLVKYAEDDLAESLGNFAGVIEYEYDWQLNDPGE